MFLSVRKCKMLFEIVRNWNVLLYKVKWHEMARYCTDIDIFFCFCSLTCGMKGKKIGQCTIIKLNFIEIVQCFHILFNYAVLVFKMKKKNKKKIWI